MNSLILHKYERWFHRFFFLFIFLGVTSMITYYVNKDGLTYAIVFSMTKILLLLSIVMNYVIINKTKEWRKNGRELTEKIGLKRILILETNLISRPQTKVYEIHHNPDPFKYGFTLRKQKRSDILNQLKEELKEDFEKLYHWKCESKDDVMFITTTHSAMAYIWGKTSEKYFYMKKMEKTLDPYVKMNLWQWISSSFSTTGRINFNVPKHWDSYYFYTTSKKNKF